VPAVVNGHIIHIIQVELAMYENLRDVMERRPSIMFYGAFLICKITINRYTSVYI